MKWACRDEIVVFVCVLCMLYFVWFFVVDVTRRGVT